MELRRFYVQPSDISGDRISITGGEYHHMTQVLRFKRGYQAIVCDNSGYDYLCTVESIDKSGVTLVITDKQLNRSELGYDLTLCMGLIKPEKMAIAVQKAVEIGVKRIIPFISEHTSETSPNAARLETIVKEACKQCGRAVLPELSPVLPFAALDWKEDDCYIAYEKERDTLLRDVVIKPQGGITVVVGSEGGFTPEEIALAASKGAKAVSLGKRILRAETAVIVALGTVCQLTEEL